MIAAADAQADQRTSEFTDGYLIPLEISSMLDAPILFGGRTVGVLCVEHVGLPRGWPRDEQVFTASLGDFVALALAADERSWTETALRAAEERYRGIFENAIEGLFQMTPEGRFIEVNPAMARMLGFDDAAGFLEARAPVGAPLFVDPGRRAELMRLVAAQDRVVGFEAALFRREGPPIWGSFSIRTIRGPANEVLRLEGSVEDVTLRRRAEDRLAHVSLHDGLTNLPNRALFIDRLAQSLARVRLAGAGSTTVILIDYDGLKLINDSLGHAVGDRLLVEMARRLSACLRPGDTLARLASDEFVVLAEGLADRDEALAFAERLGAAFSVPYDPVPDQDEIFPTASIGVAFNQGRRRNAGRSAAPCRHGTASGQGAGPQPLPCLHAGNAVGTAADAAAAKRHAAGDRAGRVRSVLPAGRVAAGPAADRVRSADSLEPRAAGADPAGHVHPHRGGERPDHRSGRLGHPCRLPSDAGLAGPGWAGDAADAQHQHSAGPARPSRRLRADRPCDVA